jgi:hypothetical protein
MTRSFRVWIHRHTRPEEQLDLEGAKQGESSLPIALQLYLRQNVTMDTAWFRVVVKLQEMA